MGTFVRNLLVVYLCLSTPSMAWACIRNVDCHPGEVCEDGACTTPPEAPPDRPPPPPQYIPEPPPPPGAGPFSPAFRYRYRNPGLRRTGIILFSVGLPVAIVGAVVLSAYSAAYDNALTQNESNEDYNGALAGGGLLVGGTAMWITGSILWGIGGHVIYEPVAAIQPTLQFGPKGRALMALRTSF